MPKSHTTTRHLFRGAPYIYMLPSPETTTLDIEGMSCAGCAPAVDKPLARTPGVQSALVNYATENATV